MNIGSRKVNFWELLEEDFIGRLKEQLQSTTSVTTTHATTTTAATTVVLVLVMVVVVVVAVVVVWVAAVLYYRVLYCRSYRRMNMSFELWRLSQARQRIEYKVLQNAPSTAQRNNTHVHLLLRLFIYTRTPCPEKRAYGLLCITLTNLSTFS